MELFKREGRKIWVSPRVYAWLISIGLVMFAVHNRALTYTNEQGVTSFFLPWVGFAFVLAGLFFLSSKDKKEFNWNWGSKLIWIPMLIIVSSTIVAGIVNQGWLGMIPSALFIVTLFFLYAASRTLGNDIFVAFIPAVVIVSISCIVMGLSGERTGGILSPTNYDISSGMLVFGALVCSFKGRWWLVSIALIGLFFTGAEEGLIGVGVTAVAILTKKDFSKRLLLPAGIVTLAIVMAFTTEFGRALYESLVIRVSLFQSAFASGGDVILDQATGYRWLTHWSLEDTSIKGLLLGHGYNIGQFYWGIQHNVPLLIIHQIGIVAAVAWLWIMGYCLFKCKGKEYILIAVLTLSALDHYYWTQVAPWWWAMIGVATTSSTKRDYIFKEVS